MLAVEMWCSTMLAGFNEELCFNEEGYVVSRFKIIINIGLVDW
jgi:hypothetical protein